MISFKINELEHIGKRLDHFLVSNFEGYSRSKIQLWIRLGRVLVNGIKRKTGYALELNDMILVDLPKNEDLAEEVIPQNLELEIIYEDDYIIAVNKSAEMVVHPGIGARDGTLINGLLYHCKNLSDLNGRIRPGIVHRLDKGTSGLILIAKTNSVHSFLADQFRERKIRKEYIGLTWGIWSSNKGEINEAISRNKKDPTKFFVKKDGKESVTKYKVNRKFHHCSLISFFPKTGRTHQIRVHSAFNGHPLFGDIKYGGGETKIKGFLPEFQKFYEKELKKFNRHALHASKLEFIHPKNQEVIILEANMPPEFLNLIDSFNSSFYG